MKFLLTLSLVLCFSFTFSKLTKTLKVNYNVTDVEYDSIPSIYHVDDYDKCLRELNKTLYCSAKIQLSPLTPEKPSRTWEIIEEIISAQRNFRHDRLRHNICVQKFCPNIPKKYYATGNGTEELWKEISKCYSSKYKSMGLKAEVTYISCKNENAVFDVDALDIFYVLVIIILVSVIVIATIYDGFARLRDPKEYENLTSGTKGRQLLTAFAVLTNWERLRSDVTTDDSKSLSVFQGIRVVNTYFVIMSHTALITLAIPIMNTKYLEDSTLYFKNMFVANGSLICQTFFILSGWLLSYTLCCLFPDKRIKIKDLLKVFFFRCLRLVPLMLLVIGFHATWLRHIGNGPFWGEFIKNEFENCRGNWYTNILFLNNYWRNSKMCLEQTWYMAADTQLFIFGLFIMMLVLNNRKYAKHIFAFFIFIGIPIVFIDMYINDYDAVMRGYPETVLEVYLESDEWLYVLTPGHISITCYVQGLLCGYYFYKFKKEKKDFLKNKFMLWMWVIYVTVGSVATVLCAFPFYQDGYEHSRLLASTFQAFSRFSFGLPISLWIFGLTMGKGGYMVSFCNWGPLQTLGRMSYSVFLIHSSILFMRAGQSRNAKYVNDFTIIYESIGDFVMSYAGATVLCLCLEMPLTRIQKVLLNSSTTTDVTKKKVK